MGNIMANGFTNGNWDILMMGLTYDGTVFYTEYMGNTISETPGAMVWNPSTS